MKWLLSLFLLSTSVAAQPNALLLVAKPDLVDPNFRESVVLVTQTEDGSTVGVILNRPTAAKHPQTGETLYSGGPVMREVMVALFRAEAAPQAPAFPVLKGVYLTMHPQNIEPLVAQRAGNYRLYRGFSGWAPGQLDSEMQREGWYLLPANTELLFRKDTTGMWDELVRKARGRVALR
ncbi:MAG TPA: YqgE/AlgH family protein [Burkholderiales bacterium]|nr:YqgE/AlgH family protein [Burkholderiales bacterium]